MNSDALKYLQQDGIGKVIAKGLADVYTNKPQTPVKYLAAWLKKYSENQREIARLSTEQTTKSWKLKEHTQRFEEENKKLTVRKEQEGKTLSELEAFKLKVQNDEYQKELLFRELPQFIEKRFGLTGAYVGYVKHPPKTVTEEDEEDNAHLDTFQNKMINYIGSSSSHEGLMLGKTLALDKGVTGGAFNLSLDDPQPAEDGTVQVKEKYVYIPNVVKNENMHYFRLPKLGAYIAVPLVYQSYLAENIFDVALDARQKYQDEFSQFQKGQEETLKEIQTQIEAAQQKLADAKEKNDEAAIETAQAELSELNNKKKEKEDQKFDEEHTELPIQKKQFVLCGDTTGKDREIDQSTRQAILQLVKHFRDSWEKNERQLLYKDVDYQISILNNLEQTPEQIIEQLQKCQQIPAQQKASFDQIEDETLRQYKKSTWQLQALKKEIKENQKYLASFFKLKNFRVVKFRSLIQTLLYYLRYEKATINQLNKTRLDWKKVQKNYLFAQTFYAVINYNSEGPKTDQYPFYCKINHISEKLEKYSEAEVYKYNIGLGALLTLIKKEIAHRISNIEIRRNQKNKQREQRAQVLQENEKITEEKRQVLEKHKQSLSGEEAENFNQEEWSAEYDKENALKEIPPEVVDDIDNDY